MHLPKHTTRIFAPKSDLDKRYRPILASKSYPDQRTRPNLTSKHTLSKRSPLTLTSKHYPEKRTYLTFNPKYTSPKRPRLNLDKKGNRRVRAPELFREFRAASIFAHPTLGRRAFPSFVVCLKWAEVYGLRRGRAA